MLANVLALVCLHPENIMDFDCIVITHSPPLVKSFCHPVHFVAQLLCSLPYHNIPYSIAAQAPHRVTASILHMSSVTGNSSEAGLLQSSQIMSHPSKPDTVCVCARQTSLPTCTAGIYIFLHLCIAVTGNLCPITASLGDKKDSHIEWL